jgi:hypothetical protein
VNMVIQYKMPLNISSREVKIWDWLLMEKQ